ncbi:MAG: spondin domain-containing protein, partial [Cyanobacteria bacterium J06648_11]
SSSEAQVCIRYCSSKTQEPIRRLACPFGLEITGSNKLVSNVKRLQIGALFGVFASVSSSLFAPAATAAELRITVESLAPANGNFITPLWFGVHDGGFDLFDVGAPASMALERIAEDGTIDPLNQAFDASGSGAAQGVVFGPTIPPIGPSEFGQTRFSLSATPSSSLYLSYAAMVLPSNDAFIGNENPFQFEIFDANGDFTGTDFIVPGSLVWDAGTEVNDEGSSTTAFFGQTVPDTGAIEGGNVGLHPGFIPGGPILSSASFLGADFTQPGYQIARIQVEEVPEPVSTLGVLISGGLLWGRRRLKRKA